MRRLRTRITAEEDRGAAASAGGGPRCSRETETAEEYCDADTRKAEAAGGPPVLQTERLHRGQEADPVTSHCRMQQPWKAWPQGRVTADWPARMPSMQMAQSSARAMARATGRSSDREARIASVAPRGGGIGRMAPVSRGGSSSRSTNSLKAARRVRAQSLVRPSCDAPPTVAVPDPGCPAGCIRALLSEARCCRMASADPATGAASRSIWPVWVRRDAMVGVCTFIPREICSTCPLTA